jgi:hypothetical protein
MANEVPNDATRAARARYAAALQKMSEMATASVNDPRMEGEYQKAVQAVADAEAALKGVAP